VWGKEEREEGKSVKSTRNPNHRSKFEKKFKNMRENKSRGGLGSLRSHLPETTLSMAATKRRNQKIRTDITVRN